jgi:hypothetical protein
LKVLATPTNIQSPEGNVRWIYRRIHFWHTTEEEVLMGKFSWNWSDEREVLGEGEKIVDCEGWWENLRFDLILV